MKFGPITEMAKRGSALFLLLIVAVGLLSGCERTSSKEESDQASLPHHSATTNAPASDSNSAMLKIPAGRFMMGEPSEADSPAHEVILSAFLLDKYLVTQDLFEKVMHENPSRWKGGNNPVEQVRWSDAVKFCNKRSELEGLGLCYELKTWKCNFDATGYRLPTEAEFEYACRAGATTTYPCGDTPPKLGDFAWFEKNSGGHPRPVGQKQANAWGLYDMCGNLWEWCNDFYQVDYYASAPRQDPKGPDAGKTRVVRGGSWRATAENCRCGYRYNENPGYADVCFGYDIYGFRCARKP
jgi:formylglycine-generating enzyme required for sulfatase activity